MSDNSTIEWTTVPEINVDPYLYRISPFAPDSEAGRHWTTWVRSTGRGKWFVLEHSNMSPESYRTAAGEWTFERDDDIRHDFDTAVRLAREAIPGITVNGYTIQDAVKRFAQVRA